MEVLPLYEHIWKTTGNQYMLVLLVWGRSVPVLSVNSCSRSVIVYSLFIWLPSVSHLRRTIVNVLCMRSYYYLFPQVSLEGWQASSPPQWRGWKQRVESAAFSQDWVKGWLALWPNQWLELWTLPQKQHRQSVTWLVSVTTGGMSLLPAFWTNVYTAASTYKCHQEVV